MPKKPLTPEETASATEARRERNRLAVAAYRERKRLAAPPSKPKPYKRRQSPPMNPRALAKLPDEFIYGVDEKGTYGDGGNLYLQVGIGGSAKSWMFIYSRLRLIAQTAMRRSSRRWNWRAIPFRP